MSFRASRTQILADWLASERAGHAEEQTAQQFVCPVCGSELDFRLGRSTGLHRFTHPPVGCRLDLDCLAWGETREKAIAELQQLAEKAA